MWAEAASMIAIILRFKPSIYNQGLGLLVLGFRQFSKKCTLRLLLLDFIRIKIEDWYLFESHQHRRHIPKHFNTSDYFAGCIVNRRGGHLPWDSCRRLWSVQKGIVDRPLGPVYQAKLLN